MHGKKSPVDNGKAGCYIGKVFFGTLLGGGLRREPQGNNRTDERHRGSQLKVPKETGTFSRKNGPPVFFCFSKAERFVRFARTNPISGKTVVWNI